MASLWWMFLSYSASWLVVLARLKRYHKGTYYGYKLTHAQTFGSGVGWTMIMFLRYYVYVHWLKISPYQAFRKIVYDSPTCVKNASNRESHTWHTRLEHLSILNVTWWRCNLTHLSCKRKWSADQLSGRADIRKPGRCIVKMSNIDFSMNI